MGTPYSDIYDRAIFRVSDVRMARLNDEDKKFVLRKYMDSAISDFSNKCLQDLNDRDEENECFKVDLTNEEQEILALGISYYWLSSQILNGELLKNKLSTKDYTYFSPANLVRETNTLRNDVRTEYKHRIVNYTYDHGNLTLDGEV